MSTENIILILLGIIGCLICAFCGYALSNIGKSIERLEQWLHNVNTKLDNHLSMCNGKTGG